MRSKIWTVVLCLLLCFMAGCQTENNISKPSAVEVNPNEGAPRSERVNVDLYFANMDYTKLVGETRSIDIDANETVEVKVLKELIKGPTIKTSKINVVINKDTKVVDVSANEDILTVILSKEFLDWSLSEDEEYEYQQYAPKSGTLAVYSIVNTLVEVSGYPKVQLLVDINGTGSGHRIAKEDLGMGSSGVLEPLERKGDLVLTPMHVVEELFSAMKSKNYSAVYTYVAYSDNVSGKKPTEDVFLATLLEQKPSLKDFQIKELLVGGNPNEVVLMVDYTIQMESEESEARTNVPVRMRKENQIWKIPYSIFERVFLRY